MISVTAVVVGSLPPFRSIISSPSKIARVPNRAHGHSPDSRDIESHRQGSSAVVGRNHLRSPTYTCNVYHNDDYELSLPELQVEGAQRGGFLTKLHATKSQESAPKHIKMTKDFVSSRKHSFCLQSSLVVHRPWYLLLHSSKPRYLIDLLLIVGEYSLQYANK